VFWRQCMSSAARSWIFWSFESILKMRKNICLKKTTFYFRTRGDFCVLFCVHWDQSLSPVLVTPPFLSPFQTQNNNINNSNKNQLLILFQFFRGTGRPTILPFNEIIYFNIVIERKGCCYWLDLHLHWETWTLGNDRNAVIWERLLKRLQSILHRPSGDRRANRQTVKKNEISFTQLLSPNNITLR